MSKHVLLGVTVFPPSENNLSDGTSVAQMAKYSAARGVRFGNEFLFSFHQLIASPFSGSIFRIDK